MSNSEAIDEDWAEIHGFTSRDEFERFEYSIAEAVAEGAVGQVDVEPPFSGSPCTTNHGLSRSDQVGLIRRLGGGW